VVAAAYLIGALVIGLWPTPVDAGSRTLIVKVLGFLHHEGLPSGFGDAALEFGANILFFVPIGVLICLLLPRRLSLLAVPLGALVSGAIELGQLLLLPARFASWNDILANTIGTVIGVAIVVIIRGIRGARSATQLCASRHFSSSVTCSSG
jgi:glycopeptide antibiotics resistance protein